MKYKGILLALAILILACGVQSAFAEGATVGDCSFTMPDDYVIVEQGTSAISIGSNDHTTFITVGTNIPQTPDAVRDTFEGNGEKYVDNKTYEYEGYNITQLNFIDTDGYYHYIYVCKNDGNSIGINMLCKNEQPQLGDDSNPATGILSSIM